jgi:hypothetical protein
VARLQVDGDDLALDDEKLAAFGGMSPNAGTASFSAVRRTARLSFPPAHGLCSSIGASRARTQSRVA